MALMSEPIPLDPEMSRLLKRAMERWESMSPIERMAMREAQRKSWVIGEFMLGHPEATREYAEAVYNKMREGMR
jgi:hypothetical protein